VKFESLSIPSFNPEKTYRAWVLWSQFPPEIEEVEEFAEMVRSVIPEKDYRLGQTCLYTSLSQERMTRFLYRPRGI
jgi:hypothetical protein